MSRLRKAVIVLFGRKLLRGAIIKMYKVKNLKRKASFQKYVSGSKFQTT